MDTGFVEKNSARHHMSRPSSPFVDVELDGVANGTPQTRLVFLDGNAGPAPSEVVSRKMQRLDEIDRRLVEIEAGKNEIRAAQNDIQIKIRRILDDPTPTQAAGVATAPPAIASEDDEDQGGVDMGEGHSADSEHDRASALSFLADHSVSAFAGRIRSSTGHDLLPTNDVVEAFLVANPDLRKEFEAEAQSQYPDYDATADPKLQDMMCSICVEILTDPAALFEQIYCKKCILNWLSERNSQNLPLTCPNTNAVVTQDDVRPNVQLKNFLEKIVQEGNDEVRKKRCDLVTLYATKKVMVQVQSDAADATIAEIEKQLDRVNATQRQTQELNQRRRNEQKRRFARLAEENRRLSVRGDQNQRALESAKIEFENKSEEERQRLRAAIAVLHEQDLNHVVQQTALDCEERQLKEERAGIAGSLTKHERSLQCQRIVRRAVLPGGQRCFRCGHHSSMQTASSMHRCFRCSKTFCHDCCCYVGGVLSDPDANENESDDEQTTSDGTQCDDTVILGGCGLTVLAWRRICTACYTTCLRTRMELAEMDLRATREPVAQLFPPDSSRFTEDSVVLLYVLNPQERETWSYLTKLNAVPRGLLEEWKMIPSRAAVLFDHSVRTAHEDVFPALVDVSQRAMQNIRLWVTGNAAEPRIDR